MDEVSRKAVDKIETELIDLLSDIAEQNQQNASTDGQTDPAKKPKKICNTPKAGKTNTPRLIRHRKPSRSALIRDHQRKQAARPMSFGYWVASTLLALSLLAINRPEPYSPYLGHPTQDTAAYENRQNQRTEKLQPAGIDLYEPVPPVNIQSL